MSAIDSISVAEKEITEWFNGGNFSSIEMTVVDNRDLSENSDYIVVKEISFTPSSLDKLFIQIYFTKDGYVGLGIETYERIYSRLGEKTDKDRFVGGFEPVMKDFSKIITLLELFSLRPVYVKFFLNILRLNIFSVYVDNSIKLSLEKDGGLRALSNFKSYNQGSGVSGKNLKYIPWSD